MWLNNLFLSAGSICKGVRPHPNESPEYNTKPSDGDGPVLKLRRMCSTPSFVAYWPLNELSVEDFSSRMHLYKQAKADMWVEPETRWYWKIIYTRVLTADTFSLRLAVRQSIGPGNASEYWRAPREGSVPTQLRSTKWGPEYGSTAWLII